MQLSTADGPIFSAVCRFIQVRLLVKLFWYMWIFHFSSENRIWRMSILLPKIASNWFSSSTRARNAVFKNPCWSLSLINTYWFQFRFLSCCNKRWGWFSMYNRSPFADSMPSLPYQEFFIKLFSLTIRQQRNHGGKVKMNLFQIKINNSI